MSSNGSTKHFINERTPASPRRQPVVVPPEIRLYPSLHPPLHPPTPTEVSRYEPNFMLGYGSLQYPRESHRRAPGEFEKDFSGRRTTENGESRYMKRPKGDRTLLDPRQLVSPPTPELPRTFGGGPTGSYDWRIPRASLWCYHKGYNGDFCKECHWKNQERATDTASDIGGGGGGIGGIGGGGVGGDNSSTCSSINPPPTFTALDNYRPVRPPRPGCRHCSCGIIFAITTIFSLLVLVLIAAFIIYIEMVLKHQETAPMDRM